MVLRLVYLFDWFWFWVDFGLVLCLADFLVCCGICWLLWFCCFCLICCLVCFAVLCLFGCWIFGLRFWFFAALCVDSFVDSCVFFICLVGFGLCWFVSCCSGVARFVFWF